MCVIGSEADTAGQGTHVFVHPKSTWPQLCKHWGYPHEGAVTEDNLAEKTLTSFYAPEVVCRAAGLQEESQHSGSHYSFDLLIFFFLAISQRQIFGTCFLLKC